MAKKSVGRGNRKVSNVNNIHVRISRQRAYKETGKGPNWVVRALVLALISLLVSFLCFL